MWETFRIGGATYTQLRTIVRKYDILKGRSNRDTTPHSNVENWGAILRTVDLIIAAADKRFHLKESKKNFIQ